MYIRLENEKKLYKNVHVKSNKSFQPLTVATPPPKKLVLSHITYMSHIQIQISFVKPFNHIQLLHHFLVNKAQTLHFDIKYKFFLTYCQRGFVFSSISKSIVKLLW